MFRFFNMLAMKNSLYSAIFFAACIAIGFTTARAQQIEPIPVKDFYKERVTKNLQLLCKEAECLDNVVINERGIYIYPVNSRVDKPEFILYWREMPHFNKLLAESTKEQIIDILDRKGSRYFYGINYKEEDPARYPVSEFSGLKVALDPGHIASNLEEAILEQRYVKVEGEYVGQKKDITFFEANLAYATCLAMKKMLEDAGAEVMLTHEYGKSSLGTNYSEWVKTDHKQDIIDGYKKDWYNREKLEYLLADDASDFIMFHDVFRNSDLENRVALINEFKPDITLIVHYNAKEGGQRYNDRFLRPVEENYSMVFIPGSFLGYEVDGNEELDKNHRFEFLRLLVSYDLEESDIFARNIIRSLNNELKVDALPADNDFEFANTYSIKSTLSDGVYHRNLFLTREIKGPIAYAEALYQDNIKEVALLGKKDFKIEGITTSSRVKDVAQVYFNSIKEWLDYNKAYSKKLDALYEDKYGDEKLFAEDQKIQEKEVKN